MDISIIFNFQKWQKNDLIKEKCVTEESERYYSNQYTSKEYQQLKKYLNNYDLTSNNYGLVDKRENFYLLIKDYIMDNVLSVW